MSQSHKKVGIVVKVRTINGLSSRPPDKSAYWKISFLIIQPNHNVVCTQKNRPNETVLLSNQNTFNLMGKEINAILCAQTILI